MKVRNLLIIIALLFVFMATTGQQCDKGINELFFGDNVEYTAIRDLVNKFKDGINSNSESILKDVISKQFETGGLGQLGAIQDYFSQELTINKITVSDINVDGRGAQGTVDWAGTVTLKPKPNIPYIADKIPVLSGDVSAGLIFGFVKESDGKWRIKAQRVLKLTKSAAWGSGVPQISKFDVSKTQVNPGDSIKVDATLNRGSGNVMLAAVNNKTLVNSLLGVVNGPIDTVKVNVPTNKKNGSTYDVNIIAIGVEANWSDPYASSITGIAFKQISVPVVD